MMLRSRLVKRLTEGIEIPSSALSRNPFGRATDPRYAAMGGQIRTPGWKAQLAAKQYEKGIAFARQIADGPVPESKELADVERRLATLTGDKRRMIAEIMHHYYPEPPAQIIGKKLRGIAKAKSPHLDDPFWMAVDIAGQEILRNVDNDEAWFIAEKERLLMKWVYGGSLFKMKLGQRAGEFNL